MTEPSPSSAGSDPVRALEDSLYYWDYRPALERLSRVPDTCVGCPGASQPPESAALCSKFYDRLTARGVVRIQVSMNYMDDSEGLPYRLGDIDMGYNASVDQGFYRAFREEMLAPCPSGPVRSCGFREEGPGRFARTVRGPDLRTYPVELEAGDSSLTPYFAVNTGTRAAEQTAKSERARESYLAAIRDDDVILYVGHSRNGGGPDFFPPVLRSNGHPDYAGYYMPRKPGLTDVLNALHNRRGAPSLMGFFSCLSEAHFGRFLVQAAPETGYIFTKSDALTDMDDNANGAVATLDSILRFQCYQGFQAELDASSKSRTDPRMNLRNALAPGHPVDLLVRPKVFSD